MYFSDSDGGGPLLTMSETRYFQLGIVYYGRGWSDYRSSPRIFTRIESYMDWIEEIIRVNNWKMENLFPKNCNDFWLLIEWSFLTTSS